MKFRIALAALTLAAGGLSACGRQGELDRPAPLIGKPSQPSAGQVTRDQAAARALQEGAPHADPQAPQSVDEVRNLGIQRAESPPASASPASSSPPHSGPQ